MNERQMIIDALKGAIEELNGNMECSVAVPARFLMALYHVLVTPYPQQTIDEGGNVHD